MNGYHEVVGRRKRYRLTARQRLLNLLGGCVDDSLAANHEQVIQAAVASGELDRNPIWTESIAVGGDAFVNRNADSLVLPP